MIDLRSTAATRVPAALAELHRATRPGQRRRLHLPDTLPVTRRRDLATGAGFAVVRGLDAGATTLERLWSLPDTVGVAMRVLVCGLNPSPDAADHGIGFHRPGNRFWPAALAAGLVSVDRDPDHALAQHGVGMTDIVKRTTRRADELGVDEYRDGLARLGRTVEWLRPGVVCFVGLSGWRAAADRSATAGPQHRRLGDRPVYLMPSTSGLNAHSSLADLTEHLRAAMALAAARS